MQVRFGDSLVDVPEGIDPSEYLTNLRDTIEAAEERRRESVRAEFRKDYTGLLKEITSAVEAQAFPETDLSEVVDGLKELAGKIDALEFPEGKEVDLAPVVKAVEGIESTNFEPVIKAIENIKPPVIEKAREIKSFLILRDVQGRPNEVRLSYEDKAPITIGEG